MNSFDESRVVRDGAGRFSSRAAGAPVASLERLPPASAELSAPRKRRGRPPAIRTGIVRKSPAVWIASTELKALARTMDRLAASEQRLRQALAERELACAGVESATVETDEHGQFLVSCIKPVLDRQVNIERLCQRLAVVVPVDLPGQTGYTGSTWSNTEEAMFGGVDGRPRKMRGRDGASAAQVSFVRNSARVRKQASRTLTALSMEAEQQGVLHLRVIDGDVYTDSDKRLCDDSGHAVSFGRTPIQERGRSEEGTDVSAVYVEGIPGVVTGEGDSRFDVDVQTHLAASDVQVVGQVFMRL